MSILIVKEAVECTFSSSILFSRCFSHPRSQRASTSSSSEPINPGLPYTDVSALTTSVIVCSRSLHAIPPLSLIGTLAYLLLRTAGRVGDWVGNPRAGTTTCM